MWLRLGGTIAALDEPGAELGQLGFQGLDALPFGLPSVFGGLGALPFSFGALPFGLPSVFGGLGA